MWHILYPVFNDNGTNFREWGELEGQRSEVIVLGMGEYLRVHCMDTHSETTIVSRVSAHGRLNITRDFGPHGRLPGI